MMNKQNLRLTALAFLTIAIASCGGSNEGNEDKVITSERQGHSVARQWNEVVLHGIRNDYARPTVHARNLFHISAAMYDAWAVFDGNSSPYLYNNEVSGFSCNGIEVGVQADNLIEQEQALSYAAYRLIAHRFKNSPGVYSIMTQADTLMADLGYDINNNNVSDLNGSSAELGNFIADCYIQFGLQDGANEQLGYRNTYYQSVNPPLELGTNKPGNPLIVDLNRWQPLAIDGYIDQAGNPVESTPDFLSPEWGNVSPFSLPKTTHSMLNRDGETYSIYHDPGTPPLMAGDLDDEYKWGFSLVAVWASHLGSNDNVMIDISPNSLGNIQNYPTNFKDYDGFYNLLDGGDNSQGYTVNPITNEPYQQQLVPRSDYARVLAEFWADGPESETPQDIGL